MSYLGIKQRRIGNVTILDTEEQARVSLRFGARTVRLREAIQSLLEEGQNQILLNLARVTYIDAGGLGELVSTHIEVIEKGGKIRLVHLTPTVRELMTNTKLLSIFDNFETESEALDSFENQTIAQGQRIVSSADYEQTLDDKLPAVKRQSV